MSIHEQEQALISAANRGEREAMERLYLDYRTWVYHLALRYGGNEADAHDVVQEVFRYFFLQFPGFSLRCRLKTYLFPIVRNKSMDLLRRQQRETVLNDTEELAAPAERSETGEKNDALVLVADLSEEHRDVLLARFVDGMKMKEIAEFLGIPPGTVKSRLHHGLNLLRKK